MPELIPVTDETSWVALEPAVDTLLTAVVTPSDGETVLEIYTSEFLPVVLQRGGSEATVALAAGESYVLHVSGGTTNPPQEIALSASYIPFDPPLHNTTWALDVNADTTVTPLDALLVINELNRRQEAVPPASGPSWYYDVNDDDLITPLDALLVINYLNRILYDGEAEPASDPLGTFREHSELVDVVFSAWDEDGDW
jgi:hypothetical protein